MEQNESYIDNYDDDNYDTFNDQTFGQIDETADWETEHEKFASFFNNSDDNSSLKDKTRNNTKQLLSCDDLERYLLDDCYEANDIVVKSISTLGLDDDDDLNDPNDRNDPKDLNDLDDPAIMTFGRTGHSNGLSGKPVACRSPPPPAILNYEEYSASPKTETIWSTKAQTSIQNSGPAINSVNILQSALIPGSQRVYQFPFHSRPIFHPFLQQSFNVRQPHQHLQHHPQRHYFQQFNYFQHKNNSNFIRQGHQKYSDNFDEYAGLMTQRDKEWLIRIQQIQLESNDPYVDDYYYVTYISRKIAAETINDDKTKPSLLLPERPKPSSDSQINYVPIQFEGSLGKIQVSNVNCPRKLLDCGVGKQSTESKTCSVTSSCNNFNDIRPVSKSEVSKFRKLLLHIEKMYVILLNIDDEDKRINALPEDARKSHLDLRTNLCDKLFEGLTNETHDKINLEIVQIKKGLALVFRSLNYLNNEKQRSIIISDLLNSNNSRQYFLKPKIEELLSKNPDFERIFKSF